MSFANETQKFAARPAPEIIGVEALKAALKDIPNAPGIYKMLNAEGKLLYVGKAKHLLNRVSSYANLGNHSNRILRMVSQIAYVETVVTQNEAEALLVEANLVRRHQPRYNVLLKDDKSFPYLRVDTSHPYPRIEKHRGSQNKPGEYYGPFTSVGALNETMALLQKIFLLRPCADTIFKNRARPCLQYQIKRCSAPCVGYVTTEQYGEQIARARGFLKGKHRDVQDALAGEMEAASAAMGYEKAALLRDRIRALTQVQQEQGLRVAGLEHADVIALARRGNKSVVQVFFFRDGTHFGNQSFHPRHEDDATDAEVLAGFLGQFYQAHTPPAEIMLNMGLDEEVVSHQSSVVSKEDNSQLSAGGEAGDVSPLAGEATRLAPTPTGDTIDLLCPQWGLSRSGEGASNVASHLTAPPSPSTRNIDTLSIDISRSKSPARGEGAQAAPFAPEQTTLAVLQEALSIRAGHKVEIWVPQRGDKLALITNAQANAEAALKKLEMERASVETHLLRVQELFALPSLPKRIEVYDNSHISGTNAIGAFIVATPEGFDKKSYRTFNIKDPATEPGDDYAMMREVFRRRFKGVVSHQSSVISKDAVTLETEDWRLKTSLPDLILIDGGLGQLHAVEGALKEIGVEGLNLVAIAKGVDRNAGREWFHMPGRAAFQLPVNDPLLHYLERLRDEAHRFAIGRHRNKRSKSFTTSALDDIPGIGSTRKRALLQHFGSRAGVETATIAELEKVTGISKATARAIYDYFHG